MLRSLHAHFDRIERMADAQFRNTREDARNEPAIVLCGRLFGGLALSDCLIAVTACIWIRDSAMP